MVQGDGDEGRPEVTPGWRAIGALLRTLPRASRGLTIAVAVGTFLLSAVTPALALVSGALLAALPAASRQGWSSPAGSHLARLAILEVALFTVSQLSQPVIGMMAESLARRTERTARTRLIRAVGAFRSLSDLEDPRLQDRIANAKAFGAAEATSGLATVSLVRISHAWCAALLSAVLLATFRWYLAVLLLVSYLGVFAIMWRSLDRAISSIEGQTQDMRRAAYLRDLAITPGAAKEIRVFALAPWILGRFDEVTLRAVTAARQMRGHMGLTGVAAAAVLLAFDTGASLFIGRAALSGELSLGQMLVFLQAMWGIGQILTLDSVFLQIGAGASTLVALEELEARAADQAPTSLRGPLPEDDTVCFESVSFSYPGQAHKVLDGLDLELPAGHSLAIVGENGAGKTTLVKLLAGMYAPTAGRITVGGADLAELDDDAWRARLAAIFQDFTRFELSLRDNVGYGALALRDDQDALAKAAERAGAATLVAELPDGWDTLLSRGYEGGIDPSGGQWQRIALARAFLAVEGGAKVLVLDEPTANLDVRAEAELYDRFLELTAGLTTVLISHRFSTVRRAEGIVVLEHGVVREQGSHDELMALGGRYAEMFTLQASRFDDGVIDEEGDGLDA